jgi:hypothetical protein
LGLTPQFKLIALAYFSNEKHQKTVICGSHYKIGSVQNYKVIL